MTKEIVLNGEKKYNKRLPFILLCLLITVMLASCISSGRNTENMGPSLQDICREIASDIKSKYDITDRNIQISPNNFWDSNTKINLPFSSVLCDALSSEFSKQGANITLQETGMNPLKIIGAYREVGNHVVITVKLRSMGDSSSTDFAVVQNRLSIKQMNARWLEPKFDRIARTLVRLLEDNYSGMTSLEIYTDEFIPGISSQPKFLLGTEMGKYIKDAFASSYVFHSAGDSLLNANAVLKADYAIRGSKMVFHATIKNRSTNKSLTGASFAIKLKNIPKELLEPKIHSLDNLVNTIADTIIAKYVKSSFYKQKANLVYIGKKSFYDASLKAVVPLSLRLAEKFKEVFSNHSGFMVTDNPSNVSDLVLSGKIHKESDFLVVGAGLDKIVSGTKGIRLENIAFDQEKLGSKFCNNNWFKVNLQGRIDYLMHELEKKSISFVVAGQRHEIVINRFKYQNSNQYPKFSNYLEGYMLDYFAASQYFSPVKNTGKGFADVNAGISYSIEGSFWLTNNNDIEIKAVLSSVGGQILSSEHINISQDKINLKWIKVSPTAKLPKPINDYNFEKTIFKMTSLLVKDIRRHGISNKNIVIMGLLDAETHEACLELSASIANQIESDLSSIKRSSQEQFRIIPRNSSNVIEAEKQLSKSEQDVDISNFFKKSDILITGAWNNMDSSLKLTLKAIGFNNLKKYQITTVTGSINKRYLSPGQLGCIEDESIIEKKDDKSSIKDGTINWSKKTIIVKGFGIANTKMPKHVWKKMAERAAILDARRKILEYVQNVDINSKSSMTNYQDLNDKVIASIKGSIKFAKKVGRTKYPTDKSAEVTLKMDF